MKQQNIVRLQEASEKADKVVEMLKKEVQPLLAEQKYLEASDRQNHFLLKVESMTADKDILRMVKAKVAIDPLQMERHLSAGQRHSDLVRAEAQLDSAKAARELASFKRDYPDYPEFKQLELFVAEANVKSADALLMKIEADFEDIKSRFDPQKLRLRLTRQRDDTGKSPSLTGNSISTVQSNEAALAELGVAPSDVRAVKASLLSLSAGLTVLEKSQLPEDRKLRLGILKAAVESLLGEVQ
jgi:hypothetical protein